MPFLGTAFGELIGDRFGESRTENFYSPIRSLEVINH